MLKHSVYKVHYDIILVYLLRYQFKDIKDHIILDVT